MLLTTTTTFAGLEQKVAAQPGTLFPITLIEKNANQVHVSKNAHKDVDYRVCNHTKLTRALAMPAIAGIELLDIGPSSCRKRFSAGLKPKECCLLKLRVGLRAQTPLRRFSANGENTFPQVGIVPPAQDWYFPTSQVPPEQALTVTETTTIEQPIVVSGAFENTFLSYPLIGVSTDNGSSWSMSNSTTTPSTTPPFRTLIADDDAFITTVSCSSTGVCALARSYSPSDAVNHTNPLLAFTPNASIVNWIYPEAITNPSLTPAFEAEYEGNGFYSTSCTNSFCAATGQYTGEYNSEPTSLPLNAIGTNNNGTWSWTYLSGTNNLANLDPTFQRNYEANTITCTSSFCINAGSYIGSSSPIPFIGVGTNTNGTWSWDYVKTSSYISSIPDFSALFTTVLGSACSKNFCFIATSYLNTSSAVYPLLLQSTDASDVTSSWTYPSGINTSNITPTFVSGGYLNAASCYDTICIAVGNFVGNYTNTSSVTADTQLPLIALTNNAASTSGATWNYQPDITSSSVLPASFVSNGTFTGASCDGNASSVNCLAVGSYTGSYTNDSGVTSDVQLPLIALTNSARSASGATWSYPAQTYLSNIDGFTEGYLTSVSCNNEGNVCVAAGTYTATQTDSSGTSTTTQYPLALITTDGGSTWSYNSSVIPSASLNATASSLTSVSASPS